MTTHNIEDQASPTFSQLVENLIDSFAKHRPVRANSLLVTLFGDSICPHGGTIWLGSIIKLVEPLGINQRLVRTSVFRLTQADILQSEHIGRRSYYSLAPKGVRQFSTASLRIYLNHTVDWDGLWRLVFTALGDITLEERETIRQELRWLGFGRLAPGVFGHPTAKLEPVHHLIKELNLQNKVAIMLGSNEKIGSESSVGALVKQCFETESMETEYENFSNIFSPILHAANSCEDLSSKDCFLLRTLLIHKFRRILLREPELPSELIPEDSSRHKAWSITKSLYQIITQPAEQHFMEVSQTVAGTLPPLDKEYFKRFGGIPVY